MYGLALSFLFLLLTFPLKAETVNCYLVYSSNTAKSDTDSLQALGSKTDPQPIKRAELLTSPTTNYSTICISDNAGKPMLSSMASVGKILLIEQIIIPDPYYDTRLGQVVRGFPTTVPVNKYPDDFSDLKPQDVSIK